MSKSETISICVYVRERVESAPPPPGSSTSAPTHLDTAAVRSGSLYDPQQALLGRHVDRDAEVGGFAVHDGEELPRDGDGVRRRAVAVGSSGDGWHPGRGCRKSVRRRTKEQRPEESLEVDGRRSLPLRPWRKEGRRRSPSCHALVYDRQDRDLVVFCEARSAASATDPAPRAPPSSEMRRVPSSADHPPNCS